MREDMHKVIVERPRRGGVTKGHVREHQRDREADALATREPIHRRHGSDKQLNENLRPLYRWIGKQVGRPWSKVYSELRERVDARSAVQLHILQHAVGLGRSSSHVRMTVKVMSDGRVCDPLWARPASSWAPAFDGELFAGTLYVCPKSGLLKRYVPRETAPKTPVPVMTIKSSKTLIFKRGGASGAWYGLEMAPLPDKVQRDEEKGWFTDQAHDAWLGYSVGYTVPSYYGRVSRKWLDKNQDCVREYKDGTVYCKSFRQLSSKEIRRHGLDKLAAA